MNMFILVVFGVLFSIVVCPLVFRMIWFQTRMRYFVPPDFETVNIETLPEEAREYFIETDQGLAALGFEPAARFLWAAWEDHEVYESVYVRRETGDIALCACEAEDADHWLQYMEFRVNLDNKNQVRTHNNPRPVLTRDPFRKRTFCFAHIHSIDHLYLLHRKLLERNALGGSPVLPEPGKEAAAAQEWIIQSLQQLIKEGYLHHDPDEEGEYRITWKGAFRMARTRIWPLTTLRKIMQTRKANIAIQKLLKEKNIRKKTARSSEKNPASGGVDA